MRRYISKAANHVIYKNFYRSHALVCFTPTLNILHHMRVRGRNDLGFKLHSAVCIMEQIQIDD